MTLFFCDEKWLAALQIFQSTTFHCVSIFHPMHLRCSLNRKCEGDNDIKPSVNLDMFDEDTLEDNITAYGDYNDYDGRETIDSIEDLGMSVY